MIIKKLLTLLALLICIQLHAETDESQLQNHHHYVNKQGKVVHSPSKTIKNQIPEGATAVCRDGSYSFSQHHSGTCSHHGGVAQWLK